MSAFLLCFSSCLLCFSSCLRMFPLFLCCDELLSSLFFLVLMFSAFVDLYLASFSSCGVARVWLYGFPVFVERVCSARVPGVPCGCRCAVALCCAIGSILVLRCCSSFFLPLSSFSCVTRMITFAVICRTSPGLKPKQIIYTNACTWPIAIQRGQQPECHK